MKHVSPKRPRAGMVAYTYYGTDERVKRHVAHLVDAGYDIDVITLVDPTRPSQLPEQDHMRFYYPSARQYDRQGKFQILFAYFGFTLACAWILLRNHFGAGRYAIVHVNNMPNFIVFCALPLRVLGVPVVLDLHDNMPEIYQHKFGVEARHWAIRALYLEERLSMKFANYCFAATHTQCARLRENGLRKSTSSVLLNLPSPARFPEWPLPESPPPIDGPFRMVYHGTLTPRLGVDLAIRAVALLRERVRELRFEITGNGEHRDELVRLAKELDVTDAVRFSEGFVPTERLAELLRGAHLGVIPSRDTIATKVMLPVKLLEYAQLGIPCVTAITPTIQHYFDESMARFVPPESPEAIADQIEYLYRHPDLRLETARNARRFFEKYNLDSERARYIDTMNALAGQRAPRA
ncbi:MAG: glycosyltransferase family 4 protein [Candidatus Hydrogenedentes bacterium]|nr:glycosyltransferase family 4 protein [Candidatus Hydrogenedentota bacterium]